MATLFDTHCHLNSKRLKPNLSQIILNSKDKNVDFILIPGLDYDSSVTAIEICHKFPNVFASVGLHPENIDQSSKSQLDQIKTLVTNPKVVAIGEVGLDNANNQITSIQMLNQIHVFKSQISLAIQYNKSLIIHSRNTSRELISTLDEIWYSKLETRTVFHCCEPNKKLLEYAIEHQIFIGVDGDVTFSSTKQEFIKHVPLNLLVLETDSPYLLPEPLRSAKQYPNTPTNLPLIAQAVSRIKEISIHELTNLTTLNAFQLFNLSK